ncbi:MAG: hypothetical protein R3264_12210 [Anaerolineae bacterium]|nr:hypothetical protein [Anaerolineae bacterium]
MTWLQHELRRQGWDTSILAEKLQVAPAMVEAVLSRTAEPDHAFCLRAADLFGKQPARVFYMAGLLSGAGLQLVGDLSTGRVVSAEQVRQVSDRLSRDERRVLLVCIERDPALAELYNELRLAPHEFTWAERVRDRYRFALLIGGLVVLVISGSLVIGLLLL